MKAHDVEREWTASAGGRLAPVSETTRLLAEQRRLAEELEAMTARAEAADARLEGWRLEMDYQNTVTIHDRDRALECLTRLAAKAKALKRERDEARAERDRNDRAFLRMLRDPEWTSRVFADALRERDQARDNLTRLQRAVVDWFAPDDAPREMAIPPEIQRGKTP